MFERVTHRPETFIAAGSLTLQLQLCNTCNIKTDTVLMPTAVSGV